MIALAAAACAGAAVALLVPPRPPLPRSARRSRAGVILGGVLSGVVGMRSLPVPATVLAAVAVAAVVGALALWRRRAARLRAAERSSRVVEVCEQLTAELVAGLPPGPALARAAAEWPPVAPVAEAFRVGADVPAAFREVATLPGAADLRAVAAAWQVAHHAGHGLAEALDRVALELRAAARTRRVVAGELASARSTARLMAALPVAVLLMGSGVGGHPWRFLLSTPVGLGALTLGLGLGWLGLWWIEVIAGDAEAA